MHLVFILETQNQTKPMPSKSTPDLTSSGTKSLFHQIWILAVTAANVRLLQWKKLMTAKEVDKQLEKKTFTLNLTNPAQLQASSKN